jgi:hypothetical protein
VKGKTIALWGAGALGLWFALPTIMSAIGFIVRLGVFLIWVAILLPFLRTATGDQSGDHYDGLHFRSTDMAHVDVTLGVRSPSAFAKLQIPRAAIVSFFDVYPPRGYPIDLKGLHRVPDSIAVQTVNVELAFPSGQPLSVRRVQALGEDRTTATDVARREETDIGVTYVAPDWPWEQRVRESQTRLKLVDRFDGLQHAPGDTYVGEEGVDDFVEIKCFPEVHPTHFCTVTLRVARNLVATARFVDFRVNGGRAFVNARSRWIRERICGYVVPDCLGGL